MAFSMRRTRAIRRKSSINQMRTNSARKARPVVGTSDQLRHPTGSKKNLSVSTTSHGGMVKAMISFATSKPMPLMGNSRSAFNAHFVCGTSFTRKRPSKREEQKHDAEQQRQPNDHQNIGRPRPVWRNLRQLQRFNHDCPSPGRTSTFHILASTNCVIVAPWNDSTLSMKRKTNKKTLRPYFRPKAAPVPAPA